MDIYIYYRVASTNAPALQARAAAMQRQLADAYGIVSGLKRRPEEQNGQQTWMEIYQAVPDGFDAVLEHAVGQAELTALIEGPRHIEYFLDASSCA